MTLFRARMPCLHADAVAAVATAGTGPPYFCLEFHVVFFVLRGRVDVATRADYTGVYILLTPWTAPH